MQFKCRCCWNVATYKVHNGKFKMISLVVKFRSFSRCRSRNEIDIAVSVVSFFQAQWDRFDQLNHQTYNYLGEDIIYTAEHEIKGSG